MGIEKKRKGNSKINDQIKKSLYNWIMHHPQVAQSSIVNYCLKVNIDGHTEPQLVPKILLQVSVIELRNGFVSYTEDAGLKEAIYVENNIIVSDSKLSSFLPTQFKKMSSRYKFICGCDCFISSKSIHFSLIP